MRRLSHVTKYFTTSFVYEQIHTPVFQWAQNIFKQVSLMETNSNHRLSSNIWCLLTISFACRGWIVRSTACCSRFFMDQLKRGLQILSNVFNIIEISLNELKLKLFHELTKKVFLNGIAKHFHNRNSLRVPFWSFFNSIWMENQHISLSWLPLFSTNG